jgi:AAA15 family ATPase/GTPase
MKLLRVSFHDHSGEWGFRDLRCQSDVLLLVGASGVGKTRVLKAIRDLKQIATDRSEHSRWGTAWSADFQDDAGRTYCWSGEFDKRDPSASDEIDQDSFEGEEDDTDRKKPQIVNEALRVEGAVVFERQGDRFLLHQKHIDAKFSPHQSGLTLLSEEDAIKPAKAALSQILFVDWTEDRDRAEGHFVFDSTPFSKLCNRLKDLESIRKATLPTYMKLAIVHENSKDTFSTIVRKFCDIFPTIEEVRIRKTSFGPFSEQPVLEMKERGISSFFPESSLSSGMRRTLLHLARLALWPDGTLILIDEFENSLGANCLDIVAAELLHVGKRLQFIITSHHPYIINSIPLDRWKVVARDQGRIEFFTTDQLKIGRSKHTAFTQLINTEVFKYGTLPK